jgi:hypothetical protein
MILKFFRHRRYKKQLRKNADFVLFEFTKIINSAIDKFEKEGLVQKSLQKEVLKFESTALLFWLFQKTDIFSETWHMLLLDEIHAQYYDRLRKNGYKFEMRQLVADDFNIRYRSYNKIFHEDGDMVRIGITFIKFFNERSKSNLKIEQMNLPLYLTDIASQEFREWKTILE